MANPIPINQSQLEIPCGDLAPVNNKKASLGPGRILQRRLDNLAHLIHQGRSRAVLAKHRGQSRRQGTISSSISKVWSKERFFRGLTKFHSKGSRGLVGGAAGANAEIFKIGRACINWALVQLGSLKSFLKSAALPRFGARRGFSGV